MMGTTYQVRVWCADCASYKWTTQFILDDTWIPEGCEGHSISDFVIVKSKVCSSEFKIHSIIEVTSGLVASFQDLPAHSRWKLAFIADIDSGALVETYARVVINNDQTTVRYTTQGIHNNTPFKVTGVAGVEISKGVRYNSPPRSFHSSCEIPGKALMGIAIAPIGGSQPDKDSGVPYGYLFGSYQPGSSFTVSRIDLTFTHAVTGKAALYYLEDLD